MSSFAKTCSREIFEILSFAKISSREMTKKFIRENKFSRKLIPVRYKLRAITLHQGENLTCGHYTTVIIYGDTEILIDNENLFQKSQLKRG